MAQDPAAVPVFSPKWWEGIRENVKFWLTVGTVISGLLGGVYASQQSAVASIRQGQSELATQLRREREEGYVKKTDFERVAAELNAVRQKVQEMHDDIRWLVRQRGGR